ncbi:MAG: Spy/CpxP family protein refolding chaperone [Burkholderiales bacterium]
MKRSIKITLGLAAAVAAGLAASVYAQAPFAGPGFRGPMGAMRGGPMFGDPSALANAHLADLKKQLNITDAQESKWQTFAGAVTQQAQGMVALRASMQSAPGTAPERIDQRTAFMKQRLAAMEALDGAVKQLYAVLTPEQKAAFDQTGPGHFGPGRFGPSRG